LNKVKNKAKHNANLVSYWTNLWLIWPSYS